MKELRDSFLRGGVSYKLVIKTNLVVVYQLSKKYDDGNTSTWYEVFRYKTHKSDKFHDDEYEKYPSDEDFGKWAWCCSNFESVGKVLEKHFNDINCELLIQVWIGVCRI